MSIICPCMLQEDNGMPVHLKGGPADALLYRSTMVLTIVGKHIHKFPPCQVQLVRITSCIGLDSEKLGQMLSNEPLCSLLEFTCDHNN